MGLRYLRDSDFFSALPAAEAARIRELAAGARGEGPAPILVLGVMPRSGTNFVRDLLALHPDVCADPGRLYEFPLLQVAGSARVLMRDFVSRFPRNAEVTGDWDALALLAGGWLRQLQREAGDRQILLKSPHVQHLCLAPLIFPDARIVLCLRDGRDVVDSSLATFKGGWPRRKTFRQLAEEWRLSAEAILQADGTGQGDDMLVLRYEDLVADQAGTLERVLAFTGLDPGPYDHDAAAALPVRGSSRGRRGGDARWQGEEKSADFKPVARWKAWPPSRRAKFDRIAGAALEAAGYDRKG